MAVPKRMNRVYLSRILAFTVVSIEMLSEKMRRSRQAFSSNFTYGYLMLLNKIIYSIYYKNYRSMF